MVATWVGALLGRLFMLTTYHSSSSCKSALSILICVCQDYAVEYDIIFNGCKSKFSTIVLSEVLVNDETVAISDKTVHLEYTTCTKDREDITLAAKNNFWKQFNMFIANFG